MKVLASGMDFGFAIGFPNHTKHELLVRYALLSDSCIFVFEEYLY